MKWVFTQNGYMEWESVCVRDWRKDLCHLGRLFQTNVSRTFDFGVGSERGLDRSD